MVTERTTKEIIEQYLEERDFKPQEEKRYIEFLSQVWVLKEDVLELLERYAIDYQEEASTKWNSEDKRKEFGFKLDVIRILEDIFSPPDDEGIKHVDSSVLKKDSEEVGIPDNRSDTASEEDNNCNCDDFYGPHKKKDCPYKR